MKKETEYNLRKNRAPTHDHLYAGVQTEEFVPDKKAWKRVVKEFSRKGTHLYEPVKSVPSTLLVLLLAWYLLLCYCAQLVEEDVATPLRDSDIISTDTSTFSEQTAWRYVNAILDGEPRVAGTTHHLQQTQVLKELVDQVAANATLPVHTDWQLITGDYWLSQSPPQVNSYINVSNIIAVLEGETGFHSNGTTSTSVLVNCHYDSVPYAIGASDNTLFCGVVLEVLAKLSKRQFRLKHNIVFLFNGAEENPLQGSHGFLQHPWSRGCTNVINLDAAGMNGKPTVFQVTDSRMLSMYREITSQPQAQSFGEFLFSSGIVPSDTDFRVFRDFGNMQGMDIAFVKMGHVYHTRYDNPDLVKPGVLQSAGDMLIKLIASAADSDELTVREGSSTWVYFEYLSWFMVAYSFTIAYVVDCIFLVFGIASVAYCIWLVGFHSSTLVELGYCLLSRILAAVAGAAVTAVLVLAEANTIGQLRYLSQAWIVIPVFCVPFAITAVAVSQYFDAWRCKKNGYNRSIRSILAAASSRVILSILLFALICLPSFSTMRYFVSVSLFLISAFAFIELTVVRVLRIQAWQHLLLQIIFSIPTVMFIFNISLKINSLLIPVMGRNQSYTPDYTVAILNVGLTAFVLCAVSGMELLFSRKRLWIVLSAAMVACIIITFIPMSPYSDDGPAVQRHYWHHTEIITHNYAGDVTDRTSGILVTQHDVYTTRDVLPSLQAVGINLNSRTNFNVDCNTYTYCNLPLHRTKYGPYLDSSLFLYTSPPNFGYPHTFLLQNKTCVGEVCILNFFMDGPPHNLITLYPREQVNITAWSFSSPVLPAGTVAGRNQYDIVHSVATYSEVLPTLEFSVTFTVPLPLQSQPIVDVAHHAHLIYHPEYFTTEYINIMNAMPRYFNIASYSSIRENYVF